MPSATPTAFVTCVIEKNVTVPTACPVDGVSGNKKACCESPGSGKGPSCKQVGASSCAKGYADNEHCLEELEMNCTASQVCCRDGGNMQPHFCCVDIGTVCDAPAFSCH